MNFVVNEFEVKLICTDTVVSGIRCSVTKELAEKQFIRVDVSAGLGENGFVVNANTSGMSKVINITQMIESDDEENYDALGDIREYFENFTPDDAAEGVQNFIQAALSVGAFAVAKALIRYFARYNMNQNPLRLQGEVWNFVDGLDNLIKEWEARKILLNNTG